MCVCVCVCERERERESVCVCVCVCVRDRETERQREREREKERERVAAHVNFIVQFRKTQQCSSLTILSPLFPHHHGNSLRPFSAPEGIFSTAPIIKASLNNLRVYVLVEAPNDRVVSIGI